MSVILETTLGDITIDLYTSERPRTCLNFLKLCKLKYYNLCLVHSVQRNFMIQTGDPLGTGRGGESMFCKLYGDQAKFFDSEIIPKLKHTKVGTVSMVNNGQNMHGSQFFITMSEDLDYLDGVHTVFGEVAEGHDVLLKINAAICDEENRPYKDIRITHTVVLDDPYNDPAGLEIPCASPEPTEEQLRTDRIGVDEDVETIEGMDMEEVEEQIKDKEAKARAKILEMVGDLPDADVRPPENVLFVCKLNPVTTDDDLEVIFSRFGPIVSCEVIRDQKTKESLQYAFIEFEKEQDCENAYFKMDNVLIDDRRIHVDFSQSVSRLNPSEAEKRIDRNSAKGGNKLVLKEKTRAQRDYEMVFEHERDRSVRQKSDSRSDHKHESRDDRHGKKSDERKTRRRRSRSRSLDRRQQTNESSRFKDYDRRRRERSRERSSRGYDHRERREVRDEREDDRRRRHRH